MHPDAPNKNYIIKHNTLNVNKTNNKFCIIAMLCTVCSTLITVKSMLDDLINVQVVIFRNFFAETLSKHAVETLDKKVQSGRKKV